MPCYQLSVEAYQGTCSTKEVTTVNTSYTIQDFDVNKLPKGCKCAIFREFMKEPINIKSLKLSNSPKSNRISQEDKHEICIRTLPCFQL